MEAEFRRQLSALLPRLSRFAYTLTRSRHEAEDLIQVACERALARIEQWHPDTRLDSWMFRIMQTIWLNEVKSRKVRDRYEKVEQQERQAAEDGDTLAETRLLLSQIEQKIYELPEKERIVLLLVCVDGFTYKEAAEITGIPVGTVMSRLARARLNLMKKCGVAERAPTDNVVRLKTNVKDR